MALKGLISHLEEIVKTCWTAPYWPVCCGSDRLAVMCACAARCPNIHLGVQAVAAAAEAIKISRKLRGERAAALGLSRLNYATALQRFRPLFRIYH